MGNERTNAFTQGMEQHRIDVSICICRGGCHEARRFGVPETQEQSKPG
jgi:hypothetical protein